MKNQSSPRIAFIDLDGTLLGPDKTVSPANLAALDRLRTADVQIVIASGRHHRNITAFDEIGEMGWVLSSQGSVVRHEQTGEVLLEMTMQPERVVEICERARKMGMSLIAYHRDGAHIEANSHWTDLYARQAGWTPRLGDFRSLQPDGFQKIVWSEDPRRIDEIAPRLKQDLAGRYDVVVTDPELLEFLAPGANKAAGAKVLASRLGIGAENSLAFGDGNNDVELLRWAGLSVAMDHGRESARQSARFVSPPGPPESAFARSVDLALSA
jgi:Cof subfamily protein (haloacid dehalogenase superfamily)